jgi:UDP-GlcNAc:undecaprenyl-phosphate GlcNAc-1-phosphate transferase
MTDPIAANPTLTGLPPLLQAPAIAPGSGGGAVPDASTIADLARQEAVLHEKIQALVQKSDAAHGVGAAVGQLSRLDIFHNYMGIFMVSFLVALIVTPFMRRLAIANGIVDRPSVARKVHRVPTAYLGGVAVFLGIMAGIVFSYTQPLHHLISFHPTSHDTSGIPGGVPISVVLGMTVIMFCGLWDDVAGIDPRAKIAGMLFAAAALATEDVGVKVAAGLLIPIAHALHIPVTTLPGGAETIAFAIPLPFSIGGYGAINVDLVYWIGTAIIAVFVLGACNASNLIDGLDGLLSGTTAIANIGLLIIALGLAAADDGPRDGARIVLCLAVLGACLGFLPHNLNPATIFLGDAGSLLLGYCTIVVVLMLGDTGKTHLVLAGLVIYAIPIIDTTLAIVRRKMSGRSISDADDQHLHHILKRILGVKGAVFALYAIGAGFAALGVLMSEGRQRVIYALIIVFASFIGVIALKIGRKEHIEREMHEAEARRAAAKPPPAPRPEAADAPPPVARKNGNGVEHPAAASK